jgi:hypothetical protein
MTFKFVIGTLLLSLLASCATSVPTSLPSVPPTGDLSESPVPAETSATPKASHTASSEQAATPDVTATLRPDAVAEVVTSDLVVRSEPAISDTSTIYPDALDAPMLLYVLDGPVAANGYDWYLVKPFHADLLPHGDELVIQPLIGWVAAAGRDGETWIEPASIDCPAPDLDQVRYLSPIARLACFGHQELELAGEFAGCFVSDPGTTSPAWLNHTGCALVPEGYREGEVVPDPGGLVMRMDGDVGMPHVIRAPIVVTGHFDDPVASTCKLNSGASVIDPRPPELVVLGCRTQFVVTGVSSSE